MQQKYVTRIIYMIVIRTCHADDLKPLQYLESSTMMGSHTSRCPHLWKLG